MAASDGDRIGMCTGKAPVFEAALIKRTDNARSRNALVEAVRFLTLYSCNKYTNVS